MLRNSSWLVKLFLVFKLVLLYDDKCIVRPGDFEGNTSENLSTGTAAEIVQKNAVVGRRNLRS